MDGSRSSRNEKGKEIIDYKGKRVVEEEEEKEVEEEEVKEAWEFLKKDETQKGRRILTEEEENEVWAILEDDNYKGRWILTEEEEKEMKKMELERETVEKMQNSDVIKDVTVAIDKYVHSLAQIVTDHSHSLLQAQQQHLLEQQQRARGFLDFGDVWHHLAMQHQLEEIHQHGAKNAEEEKAADDARRGKEEEEAGDGKNAEKEAGDAKNTEEEGDDNA